jgi:aminopeptidase N
LDLIAVPDFAAGAMENTGAITFRERLLLADPDRASLGVRKNIAAVLAHEIAHQWFGNLVTMKWWDDIWLNEGFATWMEKKPVAQWRPEWHLDLDEVDDSQSAASLDALRSTRAVRTEVETPEEINEVFDAIAYEKSAAVLRMIESFVGAETFRKAVASYVRKYSFSNAAAEDFWTEVTEVSGKPVDRIMKSYVDQPGIPVLEVDATCSAGRTVLALEQERFVGVPGAGTPSAQSWTIPVCTRAVTGPESAPRCEIITRREQQLAVNGCSDTVFANADSEGYYFSEYPPAVVATLARTGRTSLKPVERLGLLGDEWWMVRAGRHDIGVFLDLAATFADDDVPAISEQIRSRLSYAGEYIAAPAERSRYQAWIRRRFTPALEALGFPGDSRDPDDRHSRRAALATLLGGTGDSPEVQQGARDLAVNYIADPTSLSGTLAPAVLQVAALGGDGALYDRYIAQLDRLGARPEEYYRFFNALPWFRDPALVRRTLEFAVSPAVRTQDTGTLIAGLMGRPWGREAAWTFTKAQWPKLTEMLGTFQGIPTIVSGVGNFCSTQDAADVREFFAAHAVPSAERTLQQSLERIETCTAVGARQAPALAKWLAASGQ